LTPLDVLTAARAKLLEGWCQGTAFRDASGKECGELEAKCWCSLAACNVVCGGDYEPADAAMLILSRIVPGSAISIWQDAPDRTLDDVLTLFDQGIAHARAELQELTFSTAEYQVTPCL
jgi:hypothetical protein